MEGGGKGIKLRQKERRREEGTKRKGEIKGKRRRISIDNRIIRISSNVSMYTTLFILSKYSLFGGLDLHILNNIPLLYICVEIIILRYANF